MNVIFYALLAGVLPSFIWLYFWTREDAAHPESRTILALSFFGGAIAVTAAIVGEKFVAPLISDPNLRYIAWAAIEEIVKFAAVAMIALVTVQNDEPIDAMIYCIAAALGFAALENTLFILNPFFDGNILKGIVTGNMRFIGATLVHVISSAMIGFGLGLTFYRGAFARMWGVLIGLAAAITLHAAFNLSIINGGSSDTLKTFGWVWGATVLLIVLFEEVKAVRPRLARR